MRRGGAGASWSTRTEDHPGRQLVLVSEAYTPRRPDILRQYANDEEFHQSFAFDLMLAPWNAEAFRGAVRSTVEALMPAGLLPAWTLNNHDAQRCVTRFGRADAVTHGADIGGALENSHAAVDIDVGTRRARAAALFQLGLPGCVYLYAGEELGLPEVLDLADEARQDPIFARTGGNEIGRDGCRVPLPWTDDAGTAFGFSPSGKSDPWLPQPKEWARWNVTNQQVDPASVLSLYRRALAVRRATPDLTLAGFELLLPDDPDLVAYRRGEVVVVLNMSDHDRSLPADLVADHRVLVSSVADHVVADQTQPRIGGTGRDRVARALIAGTGATVGRVVSGSRARSRDRTGGARLVSTARTRPLADLRRRVRARREPTTTRSDVSAVFSAADVSTPTASVVTWRMTSEPRPSRTSTTPLMVSGAPSAAADEVLGTDPDRDPPAVVARDRRDVPPGPTPAR